MNRFEKYRKLWPGYISLMKKSTYVLAFILGGTLSASFFATHDVDGQMPMDRFLFFCAYSLAGTCLCTLVDEAMKRVTRSNRALWFPHMFVLWAIFLFAVALVRVVHLFFDGANAFVDPIAVGFFILSLSFGLGIGASRLILTMWDTRRSRQ